MFVVIKSKRLTLVSLVILVVFLLPILLSHSIDIIYGQEKKALTFQNVLEELRCGTREMPLPEIIEFIKSYGGDPKHCPEG